MPPKPHKSTRASHHPIRRGPAARRHKPAPSQPKAARAAVPVERPPVAADVLRWLRIGAMDGLIFMLGSLGASIIQMRTGIQWIFLVGIVIAIALTNRRKLPARPKPIKAGYFSGMSSLFTVGMVAMLFVMPPDAWGSVIVFGAILAVVSIVALTIGLRSVAPAEDAPQRGDTDKDTPA